jgi:hypothetical protein
VERFLGVVGNDDAIAYCPSAWRAPGWIEQGRAAFQAGHRGALGDAKAMAWAL